MLLGSEKASIDEAFIDFTRPVREELLRRYPHLASVPPDAPNGLDTPLPPPPPISWDGKGTVVPVVPRKEESKEEVEPPNGESSREDEPPAAEIVSNASEVGDVEEDAVEEDDEETTWHDVALSIAGELMMRIREDIRAKLGYTTSAGIARNKFLAKVTLSYCVPNMAMRADRLCMQLTASYKKPMNQVRNIVVFCVRSRINTLVTNRPFSVTPPSPIILNLCRSRRCAPVNICLVVTFSNKAASQIRFLGGKLGKALAEEYDVSTVSDLL